ncbi:hypothetical protein, partial [Clostridium perfringens]|uniref:hypothetical protein n=1 Tax=Clostridium perfringens TaxID=1502 RepID=UPI002ACBE209
NIATSIGITINSLRIMDSINWKRFFSQTSKVEEILKQDPAEIYEKMDFETKDYYRHRIEEISRKTNIKELDLVKTALELSTLHFGAKDPYKRHIDYYIVDDGINDILRRFNINNKIDNKISGGLYLSIIFFGTILVDLVVLLLTYLIPLNFSI